MPGAALLPDLDHPSSTATRRFSVFSWLACNAVRPLSVVRSSTSPGGRRDHGKGTHRGLTHTAVGAVLLGLAVNLASAAWGTPVLLGTLFVCIALAIKGLDALARASVAGDRRRPDLGRPGVGARRHGGHGGVAGHGRGPRHARARRRRRDHRGAGAPLLWPLPIRGRTWYPVGSPKAARFRTGGAVESWLVAPALTVSTLVLFVLVVPGVLPVFTAVRDQAERLFAAA